MALQNTFVDLAKFYETFPTPEEHRESIMRWKVETIFEDGIRAAERKAPHYHSIHDSDVHELNNALGDGRDKDKTDAAHDFNKIVRLSLQEMPESAGKEILTGIVYETIASLRDRIEILVWGFSKQQGAEEMMAAGMKQAEEEAQLN